MDPTAAPAGPVAFPQIDSHHVSPHTTTTTSTAGESDDTTTTQTDSDSRSTARKLRHARNRSASAPFDALQPPKPAPLALRNPNAAGTPRKLEPAKDDVRRISPSQIEALMRDPDSVPVRPAQDQQEQLDGLSALAAHHARVADAAKAQRLAGSRRPSAYYKALDADMSDESDPKPALLRSKQGSVSTPRPAAANRALSLPNSAYRRSSVLNSPLDVPSRSAEAADARLGEGLSSADAPGSESTRPEEPREPYLSLPLPPMSMPALLELELATGRPSPLYIYRHATADVPYESTKVKLERLANFLFLPPQLEQVLLFGALSCLDAWLWTFTILPIRFLKALWMFLDWFGHNALHEVLDLSSFTMTGVRRMWLRYRGRPVEAAKSAAKGTAANGPPSTSKGPTTSRKPSANHNPGDGRKLTQAHQRQDSNSYRSRSNPSILAVPHKADLLQGLLIAVTCAVLMKLDASRMYHAIRGQAAIKLYVIYNCLEVFDRLFSALGQDVLECLFSNEVLERHPWGRSKILQPFWLFVLALVYCVAHATSLLYQTVTLNVAVNSYSNALLTLLMSNQFVEIKGAVFKKIEKENLFQLTCADAVERFQLWLMLLVIGLRNLVEVGGLSFGSILADAPDPTSSSSSSSSTATAPPPLNETAPPGSFYGFKILPASFTMVSALPALQVLTPFLIVLASETIVDWLKHAYINKFNATSPRVYGRFLDVLAKDYYTHAFSSPFSGMVRRVGLPVIPLACLFIRATLQTYHMFLAANISPISSSSFASSTTTTSIATQEDVEGPGRFNILQQVQLMFRQALGKSSLGGGSAGGMRWSVDDAIALLTMIVFFLALYLILLAFKLALGMVLLRAARARYNGMHERAHDRASMPESRRIGGWSMAELGDERRKVIYEDDKKGLAKMRERESRAQRVGESEAKGGSGDLEGVQRYSMAAKRIW